MKKPKDSNRQIYEIQQLIIRYEKYGALYQILSAEVVTEDATRKYAVIAVILSEAKETLERESEQRSSRQD
jgi:hypothetical protein